MYLGELRLRENNSTDVLQVPYVYICRPALNLKYLVRHVTQLLPTNPPLHFVAISQHLLCDGSFLESP